MKNFELVVKPLSNLGLRGSRAEDAGTDLMATDYVKLMPHEVVAVPTGVTMAIPEGMVGLVCPRSGLSLRGVTVMNAPGVIDSGFRGEVQVLLINHSNRPYIVAPGDRIAQLLFVEYLHPTITNVDTLPSSERGTNGFGSTGR